MIFYWIRISVYHILTPVYYCSYIWFPHVTFIEFICTNRNTLWKLEPVFISHGWKNKTGSAQNDRNANRNDHNPFSLCGNITSVLMKIYSSRKSLIRISLSYLEGLHLIESWYHNQQCYQFCNFRLFFFWSDWRRSSFTDVYFVAELILSRCDKHLKCADNMLAKCCSRKTAECCHGNPQ